MRSFWLKITTFTVPFVIPFFMLTGGLAFIGESMPLRVVLWHQQSDEIVLFRPRYGNRDQQYKQLAVNLNKPDVMAIGSSRVLQIREEFFIRNPDAFYNAAAPAWQLEQVYNLLTTVDKEALPDILLLGIDPPWFVESYEGDTFPEPVSDFANFFIVNRSYIQDVADDVDFSRPNFDTQNYQQRVEPRSGGLALGMRAIRDGHGFRNDGSEQFGDYLVAGWLWQPQQRERHLELMRNGEDVYPYGEELDPDALAMIRALLNFAQENDILVIGFMPSYTPTLWQEMLQTGNHTYIPVVTDTMRAMFDEYEYPFFDYSDGAWVGATDEDFFDGWHASERANLQLYLDILANVPELVPYSDAVALQQIVDTAPSTWFVFGD